MKVPDITAITFKVGKKYKGKRPIWCSYPAENQTIVGWSETSIELAYRDFRRQWKALTK